MVCKRKPVTFQPIYYVAPRWVQIAAAGVGTALEILDILVYGYLAVTLSSVFFSSGD
jgi:hypothetical protein